MSESTYKNLEWKMLPLETGGALYYFPKTMAIIEFDRQFDSFLKDLVSIQNAKNINKKLYAKYPPEYVNEVLANLEFLQQNGILGGKPDAHKPPEDELVIGRLIVANTMRCNLACRYCYNCFDSNRSQKMTPDMTEETFDAMMEFMESRQHGLPTQELLFIGGEPFVHMDAFKRFAMHRKRYKDKGSDVYLSATTNATLLTDKALDFCSHFGVNIKITLDGSKEQHDRNRVYPNGAGSYDVIMKNLAGYFHRYTNPKKYVTTTVDTLNTDLEALVMRFTAMGFNIIELTELYSQGEKFSADPEETLQTYKGKYRKVLDFLDLRTRSRNYLHIIPVHEIVRKLHVRFPSFYPCRAGIDYFAVDPGGNLYPCHHFYGDGEYVIGNVADREIDPDKYRPYRTPVDRREECDSCWARYLCGGPCYHRSLAATGDAFKPFERECLRKKALLSEIIRFYYKLKVESPEDLKWYIEKGKEY